MPMSHTGAKRGEGEGLVVGNDRDKPLRTPAAGGRPRPTPRVILATAGLVVSAAGLTVMVGSSSASSQQDRATRPAGPELADLSSRVSISNGDCSFGSALDRAIHGMIRFEGTPPVGKAARVELGARHMIPVLTSTRDEGGARPGFRSYEASVRLSPAANWNGLRLTGLRLSTGWEWSASSLEFSDSPARVQAALRAMNIAIPLPPGRRDIPTDACSVSIEIQSRPRGSALTCSGGC